MSDDKKNIEKITYETIASVLGVPADFKGSDRITEDLGADSLDAVEIIMALEEAFGLEISDEEAEKLTTIQLVVDYVKSREEMINISSDNEA